MKKGLALAWGGILVICLVTTFVVIYLAHTKPAEMTIVANAGKTIGFANDVQLYNKMFLESIESKVQRAAYDSLDNSIGKELWTESSPTKDDATNHLILKIKNKFSNELHDDPITITWDETEILIIDPKETAFTVAGSRIMNTYNIDLDSTNVMNNIFNEDISSSYFKLFNLGRTLMETEEYIIGEDRIIGNPDSSGGGFSVLNIAGEEQSGCAIDAAQRVDVGYKSDGYWHIPMKNMVRTAIMCGYKDKEGIQSNGNPTEITNALVYDLQSRYSGMDYDLYYDGSQTEVMIIDMSCKDIGNKYCYYPLQGKSSTINNNEVPYGLLRLRFNIKV